MKIVLTLIKVIVIFYLFLFSYLNYNSVEVVLFSNIGPLTDLKPIAMPLFVVVFASFGAGLLLSVVYISISKVKSGVTEYKLNKTIRIKDKEIFSLKERFLSTNATNNNTGAMSNLSLGISSNTTGTHATGTHATGTHAKDTHAKDTHAKDTHAKDTHAKDASKNIDLSIDIATGTPDKGTPDKGTPDKGTSNKGASDKGASSKGASDKGASDKGASDKGASDKGASDKGASSKGASSKGASSKGASSKGLLGKKKRA